jgi:hypothetical protein
VDGDCGLRFSREAGKVVLQCMHIAKDWPSFQATGAPQFGQL